jgi:hypothetical protein
VTLLAAALVSLAGTIGADSRWLAALGRMIVEQHRVPAGVPYAAAPSAGWHNALLLAELLAAGLYGALGDHGLLLAQAAAVAGAFALLGADARRAGAGDTSTALVLLVVLVGTVGALTTVRLQLFSLVLFPLLFLLLRDDRRRPSRRIWLLVPLLALWSNLHGGVLVGVGAAGLYLVLDRGRRTPATAAVLAAACVAATLLTPSLLGTPRYFVGLLTNAAATDHIGLWAAPSPRQPADVLMVAAVALLAFLARRRLPLWELATALVLAVLTARAARSGVWLVLLLAPPAAAGLQIRRSLPVGANIAAAAFAFVALLGGLLLAPSLRSDARLIHRAIDEAHGRPILAEAAPAEQVAAEGGRVWLANPLDAFSRSDQRLWLHWAGGRPSGDAARSRARVIVVATGGPAARRILADPRFRRLAQDAYTTVYVR